MPKTMPKTILGALLLLPACAVAGAWLTTPDVDGCCMVPREYPGDVDQSRQDVLILHAGGHQELVLRVRPFFHEAEGPPTHLAWLVTTPSKPTAYRTASKSMFEQGRELYDRLEYLYESQRPRDLLPEASLGMSVDSAVPRSEKQGLEVSAPVTVGPYTITEVRTRGPAAVDELNAYLETNGFGTEDPGHLAWFAANDFTFLCIRIDPPEGSVRLGSHLDLVPLQIGFPSERPYYPGKYSANQGNFALELTLVTDRPLARGSLAAVRSRLHAHWHSRAEANLFTVKPLPEGLDEAREQGFPAGPPTPARWYVNRIDSSGFNRTDRETGEPEILGWDDDVTWSIGGPADEPPDWYYGDGEQPLLHPHNRRRIYAALLLLVCGGLGFWLLRRARRRSPA